MHISFKNITVAMVTPFIGITSDHACVPILTKVVSNTDTWFINEEDEAIKN